MITITKFWGCILVPHLGTWISAWLCGIGLMSTELDAEAERVAALIYLFVFKVIHLSVSAFD